MWRTPAVPLNSRYGPSFPPVLALVEPFYSLDRVHHRVNCPSNSLLTLISYLANLALNSPSEIWADFSNTHAAHDTVICHDPTWKTSTGNSGCMKIQGFKAKRLLQFHVALFGKTCQKTDSTFIDLDWQPLINSSDFITAWKERNSASVLQSHFHEYVVRYFV